MSVAASGNERRLGVWSVPGLVTAAKVSGFRMPRRSLIHAGAPWFIEMLSAKSIFSNQVALHGQCDRGTPHPLAPAVPNPRQAAIPAPQIDPEANTPRRPIF